MTKIDPTPLIAEAQARDTALKVALDKIETLERAIGHMLLAVLVMFWIGVFFGAAIVWVLA